MIQVTKEAGLFPQSQAKEKKAKNKVNSCKPTRVVSKKGVKTINKDF